MTERNWNPSSFNRRQQARQADKAKNRGGNFKPREMEQLGFDVDETFYARFLRPPDGNIHVKAFHWPAGGPPYACTCNHPLFNGQCVFCHVHPDGRGKRKTNDVIEVIDFRYFHIVPNPKKEGSDTIERCRHDEPEPKNNRCHNCNGGNSKSSERHFGAHKVAELNNNQYNQWWAAHQKLTKTCIAVVGEDKNGLQLCGQTNYPIAYVCESCEDVMVSEEDVRKSPPKQIAVFVNAEQKCQSCAAENFPFPIFQCEGGGRTMTPSESKESMNADLPLPEGIEHWAVQGSIFDKAVEITIAGETKDFGNGPVTMKNLNISTGTSDDWSPVSEDLANFGFSEEEIEKMCEPWDLNHRYRPMYIKREDGDNDEDYVMSVLDKQAESARVDNPFRTDGPPKRAFAGGGGGPRSFRKGN